MRFLPAITSSLSMPVFFTIAGFPVTKVKPCT
jgi:hypothetical protein